MADVLFTITCTTCETRLNVRDTSAIGAIVNCPKCQSMVQVTPPDGWQEPAAPQRVQQSGPVIEESAPRSEKVPSRQSSAHLPQTPKQPASGLPKQPAAKAPDSVEPVSQPAAKPKSLPGKKAAATTAASVGATATTAGSEPPLPTPEFTANVLPTETAGLDAPPIQTPPENAASEMLSPTPVGQWASPAEAAMRRWLWWGAVPAAGLVMLLGAWSLLPGGKASGPTEAISLAPVADAPDASSPALPTPLSEFDVRWIPDSAQFVLRLDMAGNESAGQLASLLKTLPPLSGAILDQLFQGFGLKPAAVEHLTWSSPDVSDWTGTAAVVIRLAEGQSTSGLRSAGSATPWSVEGIEFRQLDRPTWPRPFAVLDERTIVTGEAGLLRQLAQRAQQPASLGLLEPLLVAAPADADFFFALDLQAADEAGWPLPTEWLDVWPQGRDAWQVIWNLPAALSFSFDGDDFALGELGFLCDAETVADKVRAALEQWIPQARSVLNARAEGLAASAGADTTPAASTEGYRLALQGAAAALASTHLEIVDRCVWVRADLGNNARTWTAAAADSRPAMQADWYRAAGKLDETLHASLHGALSGYDQAEQRAVAGAINSGPLPPDQVLSWITAMLPYLGHDAWAEDLDPRYSWNSPKNRPVTQRPLEAVQNPAVSQGATDSGFPVTHYVGVAGIGRDAADLPRDNPRAGIFGYRQSRRLTDVPDGASNTIATVGVGDQLGSWASGGTATVRGFTQQPYVNGPDGFGSGQPGGMYVGMADGSSRFLAANIDPSVLEQLVTAAGGEVVAAETPPATDVVRVDPKPVPPPEVPAPPGETPVPVPEESEDSTPQSAVDVAERLETPLPGIAMTSTPLNQAIRAIENCGLLLVTFDLDTMSALGVPLDRPVSLHITETSVGEALEGLLTPCGLKAVARDNEVWVTGALQASTAPRTVRYAVSDLTSPAATSAADIASWLRRLVAPETWQDAGGQGTVRVEGEALLVSQTEAVHLEILIFCEKLRVARGLSPRSGRPAAHFPLASRHARAASCLQQPVTINFFRPTAIQRVLRELDQRCDAQLGVDWLALAAEGKLPGLPTPLSVSQVPLAQALDKMLEPLGLDYRAVDEQMIEVTTRAAADARFEWEFYPLGKLPDAGQTATALIDRVQRETNAGTWEVDGGKGVLVVDESSRCLIVRQTHRGQLAVERWLNALHDDRALSER